MPRPEEIGAEDLTGRAIRGYALGELIGNGGMGAVYRAVQPLVEREVAIKIVLPQYANHPDFVRRFEVEAQLVARLEHPHIVPLYDYWREPGVAYLVMRLLRGGSLRQLLEHGPLPVEMTLRMLEQVGSALGVAHRAGVVHRDLKPANVLLDEDQNAYLADFGIAKNLSNPNLEDQTHLDVIVGSPAYISPEQIRSEFVRPQTDIYCLGVVLYELLTGHVPFYGPTPIEVLHQHLSAPLPPLAARRAGLPGALDAVIEQATAKDPMARYPDVEGMLADLRRAVRGGFPPVVIETPTPEAPPLTAADNPYKGLRAFGEGDAADFFGREALTQQLLIRLGEGGDLSRFLAVVGPSGSGKSSVVGAGLVPALRRGGLPGSDQWFIVELMPGAHPLEELEAVLLRIAVNPPESLLGQLREDKRGLLRAVRRCLPDDPNVELVLVIDQFEEIFTLVQDESVRAHLLDSLVTAVLDDRSRLRVIVTLRADFTDRPLSYVDFGELVRQRAEFVLPLTPDELEHAIVGPADRVDLRLEPGLAEAIIRNVGEQPGALPLLQYALTELFEKREGRMLTKAAYHAIGGVTGALGRRAEEVFASLDEAGQATARQLFLRLVTLGEGAEGTRRRVLRSELASLQTFGVSETPKVLDRVIEAFGRSRLLSFDRDPVTRGPTVEVTHEALLREWPRLREWLNESRADVRLQRQLAQAAHEWPGADHDSSFLLTGTRLAQFEGWAANTSMALTQDERVFLDASLAEREKGKVAEAERQAREAKLKQRVQRVLQVLVGMFLLAAVISGSLALWANSQRVRAEEAGQEALRRASIGLAAQARLELDGASPERSVLLALEALENYPYTWQAEQALSQIVRENRLRHIVLGHRNTVSGVAWSPDGTRLATSSRDGTVKMWDTASWTESLSIDAHAAFDPNSVGEFVTGVTGVRALAWSPDGRQIATLGNTDETASVWDAQTGEKITSFTAHTDWVLSLAWSPDGTRIVTASKDGTAQIWDAATGLRMLTFSGHSAPVRTVGWSPDGARIATGGEDGVIKLWEAETGDEILALSGHTGAVRSAAWSPNGTELASAGEDGTIRIWDVSTGEETSQIRSTSAFWHVAWSPDGMQMASTNADGLAQVWDVATGTETFALSGRTAEQFTVTWSPDGEWLATSGGADFSARVWAALPNHLSLSGIHTEQVGWAMWSPDGNYIATASDDSLVVTWDAKTGEANHTLSGHTDWIQQALWSPDGTRIATAGWDNTVKLWDVNTGKEILTFTGHAADPLSRWDGRSGILNVVWSPDGALIASAGLSGWVRVWRAHTGEELFAFRTNEDISEAMGWSPDGTRIATCAEPHILQMWDATTSEAIFGGFMNNTANLTLDNWAPGCINLSWSPEGGRIATTSWSGGNANIWSADTGEQLLTFTEHAAGVQGVAWSPNGDRVATGDNSGVVKVWDAETGTELLSFRTAHPNVWSLDWSPDGSHLVGAGGLTSATVWRVWQSHEALIEYTRACCAVRQLTPEEREQFGLPPAPAAGSAP